MSALGKLALCLLLAATQQPALKDPRQAQRERFLEIARRYAEFEWKASERNVLHGPDANKTWVDTPDVSFDAKGWRPDGSVNHGMPYAWGGFTSIEEFEGGLDRGLLAGNVPKSEQARPSRFSLGLDCSGYIARCWDLPIKQSTRSLGPLCYALPNYSALEPGDILNKFDGHVVLFERWIDAARTRMRVYEAGRLGVVASEYAAKALESDGFEPMRYKPLDARWVPMELRDPVVLGIGPPGWAAQNGDATLALTQVECPLRDAQPGEWARYEVTNDDLSDASTYECTTMVATVVEQRVDTQTDVKALGKTFSTGRTCEHADVVVDALLDFVAYEEPLGAMKVRECTVTRGTCSFGGLQFPGYRIEAQLTATHVVRHQESSVKLAITCVLSPRVPAHGVLEAKLRRETTWPAGSGFAAGTYERAVKFQLLAFGGLK